MQARAAADRAELRRVQGMDPARVYDPHAWQLLDATCAKLLNYPDRPAPEGSQLEPEVAESMPRISADGRTYTFGIRRGFRFSSGEPVTAQTFRFAIERSLDRRIDGPGRASRARCRPSTIRTGSGGSRAPRVLSGPERCLTYGRLDAELARDAAPLIAYANRPSVAFFSARIGCRVYQPVYGVDVAALCIRHGG